VSSAKHAKQHILEKIRRNVVQLVNMNNFSSNIFPSAPFLEKMGENDVLFTQVGRLLYFADALHLIFVINQKVLL
jgi:hypothetical protein